MSNKQAFFKKVTIVSGTVLALSTLTGCFGKEEASSKEKSKKKTEEVKKEKKTEKDTLKEEVAQKDTSPEDINHVDTTSVTKKENVPIVSTATAKKYLTEDETKQLTQILQTNQKSKAEQEKLPAPTIEAPKIEPSPSVTLTPLGNTSTSKEPISLEKPTPPTSIEKPKVTIELPSEPDKPKPPVIVPPIDDGGGDKPKPPVTDPPTGGNGGDKPKPPVEPPTEPEKPKPIIDSEAPKMTAKENLTVQQGQNLNPHDLVNVTDNMDNDPLLSINGNYDTSQVGEIQIEVVAIDKAGNRSSITVTVTVIDPNADKDTEAPVIKTKENITVTVGQILSVQDLVTVSDNKDANPIVSIGKYDTSKVGEIQVEVIAVDSSGNQASVTVSVKVIDPEENKDTEAPVITPKGNVAVKVGQILSAQDLVTVSDNKDANPIVSIGKYDTSKAGEIQVEVIAVDSSGNQASVTVSVKVIDPEENKDTEAPVITPKGNVTVKVGEKLSAQDLITVKDNKDANPVLTVGAYDTSKAGDIQVEVMAADKAGNRSVTKVSVKVVEEQKPKPPVEPPIEPEKPKPEETQQPDKKTEEAKPSNKESEQKNEATPKGASAESK
ncbi:HYR domain-containing protein [Bacillus cereus]|uniref:HYR domain-containing protein n=1 Tax=Bacillus cereus TaxID=1396 RepID=UPI000B75494E|nr:HYR domain-containing protein [Bacillus cereus]OUB36717.1 hypothetical protein BK708_02315 [Bacillus thuringiensis serovar yunnanensis]